MTPVQSDTPKEILVLGGAGFLGTNLCDRLLRDGNRVTCIDTYNTGRESNIAHLKTNPNFTAWRYDITMSMWPIFNGFDQIYNLACPASPTHYQFDPINTMRVNILGAMNVLELARWSGARVLQASTSEVYGNPMIQPQSEDYWGNVNPIGIRSCYDEGKRAAETLFFDYHRQHQTKIRVIRIFNTYGPYMHPSDGRVVPNFIKQALLDDDITLHGNGEQTRAFCYVDDLISGMIRMMNSSDHITGPINLGNPYLVSMKYLAEYIIKLTGSKSKIIHLPMPSDDPVDRCPDISRAIEQLKWRPKITLHNGLIRTINYMRDKV